MTEVQKRGKISRKWRKKNKIFITTEEWKWFSPTTKKNKVIDNLIGKANERTSKQIHANKVEQHQQKSKILFKVYM